MRQTSVFGKRSEPHTVIIARGDQIRHFTIRPWMAALTGSAVAAAAIGYMLATSYLVLRDDLIGAAVARQARIQQAYEDRISALRAQVDRITSRQLLDQQLMEEKVGELLARQEQLTSRHGKLGAVIAPVKETAPVPAPKPNIRADIRTDTTPLALGFAALPWTTRTERAPAESTADRADRIFVSINQSLRSIESEQIERIRSLTEGAYETAEGIVTALQTAGMRLEGVDETDSAAAGGPLLPPEPSTSFDKEVAELDEALAKLDTIKTSARRLPIANPAPGHAISSRFGVRRDPILGIRAMHAGMDFRAATGSIAKATAPGKVIKAGWNGGYGRMVEIEHADGFSTRYAHLSKVLVKEGQTVALGDPVGKVGSTGRSTGPHLHYEVRKNGDALDPVRFLKAGKKVADLL